MGWEVGGNEGLLFNGQRASVRGGEKGLEVDGADGGTAA